jgi:hypothetical protein
MRWIMLAAIAALGAAGAARAQTLPGSQAPDQPLTVLQHDEDTASFLGEPTPTADGRVTVWSWSFYDTGGPLPNGSSFQNEFDCASRTYRRVRQEVYEGDRLLWASETPHRFRAPMALEAETRNMALVCDGGLDALPKVESPVAARALLRSR